MREGHRKTQNVVLLPVDQPMPCHIGSNVYCLGRYTEYNKQTVTEEERASEA
jgi:hypothetical protein